MNYKHYIVGILALIASIAIGWFSLFQSKWLLIYTFFTYIFGYLLLALCLTPAGNVRLGSQNEALPLGRWLVKLFVGQGVLLIFSLSAYIAYFSQGPDFVANDLSTTFIQGSIKDYSWMWGIFPWGIYGFWGLALSYVVYLKKGQPFFYQLARGFFSKRVEPMLKSYVEGTVNGATMIALCLVACAIILLLSYGIETLLNKQHFAVPGMTYIILSFFMLIVSLKQGRNLFKYLTVKSQSYILFYLFMIIVLVGLFVLSSFAGNWFVHTHPDLAKIHCEQCYRYFMYMSEEERFASIYWGWWLIWTPLAGSYLASISKGRKIREFVIGLFLLPAILYGIYLYWGIVPVEKLSSITSTFYMDIAAGFSKTPESTNKVAKALMLLSLGMLSIAIFTIMLSPFKNTTLFSRGYMPLTTDAKENRLWLKDPTKSKGVSKVAQKLAFVMMGTLFVHTLSGWYGLQVEVLAMGILVLNAAYAGFHLCFIRFIKDKIWIGNQKIALF